MDDPVQPRKRRAAAKSYVISDSEDDWPPKRTRKYSSDEGYSLPQRESSKSSSKRPPVSKKLPAVARDNRSKTYASERNYDTSSRNPTEEEFFQDRDETSSITDSKRPQVSRKPSATTRGNQSKTHASERKNYYTSSRNPTEEEFYQDRDETSSILDAKWPQVSRKPSAATRDNESKTHATERKNYHTSSRDPREEEFFRDKDETSSITDSRQPQVSRKPSAAARDNQSKTHASERNYHTSSRDPREDEFFQDKDETSSISDSIHGTSSQIEMEWKEPDVLAELEGLDNWVAQNLVKLFEGDNTIPFIARYRKEMTGNMEPEQLRHAKESFEEIKIVKHKAVSIMKNIEKQGKLAPPVRQSILGCKSLSDLELVYAPFRPGSKKTLAERARQLGLEHAALAVLNGSEYVSLGAFVSRGKEGPNDVGEVKLGIQHIIAEIISKDRGVLDLISKLRKSSGIRLESSRAKGVVAKELAKESGKDKSHAKAKSLTTSEKQTLQKKFDEESKFRSYFEFSVNINYVKPHQVLAINRGENQKELTVRLNIPEVVLNKLTSFCERQWLSKGVQYDLRTNIFSDSIKDSYSRLIIPLINRQVRSELNQNAERASIEVFAVNLKKLLLMPPLRGRVVLGIDPGFRHGCKVALVSQSGEVLEAGIFNLNYGSRTWDLREDPEALWLRKIMWKHRCETIALGNGTACRETEEYLTELLQSGFFGKNLDVSYTIVSEQGASIYSCSKEAAKEFPDMDPNLISAVSIARRLQDPLSELVKVEPSHLGVGMYQLDVPEKKLTSTLDDVVVECVSFVGVDINTAPHCLLRRIAGLNTSRADKILDYRKKCGPFITREEIKKVKGIGEKSFEQCAGFIRIIPETIRTGSEKCNPLDRTWIHPESYNFASKFLEFCHVKLESIGSVDSIRTITKAVASAGGTKVLAQKFNEKESVVQLVSEGLQMPSNHDFRAEFEKPLFRKGLTNIHELQSGEILTGRITNTTHFGAFVDIGVGQNGLIHTSGMNGKNPQMGDKVQVKVKSVEIARQRIALQLLAIL